MKVIFIFFLFIAIHMQSHAFARSDFSKRETLDQKAQNFLSKMSLEEKVGQIFMIGFSDSRFTVQKQKHLNLINPGFIILFRKNLVTPSQTEKLIEKTFEFYESKKFAPPLFAVDQEGGDVVRVPTTPPLPSALSLGELGDIKLTFEVGKIVGKILSEFRIYMNLAPVLDVADSTEDTFLQTRTFGNNPNTVSAMASSFIDGMREYNVLGTAKHFPGIGSTANDSHKKVSFAEMTEEELNKSLEPYKNLIQRNKLDAVMMTHHIFKMIDQLPATYSPKIISKLRDQLKFDGIILTDDVEMIGAHIFKTPEQRAVEAFKAGNDVIMVAWNTNAQRKAFQGVLKAVQTGAISENRLNQSVLRILKAKLKTSIFDKRSIELDNILTSLRSEHVKTIIDSILIKKLEKSYEKNNTPDFIQNYFVVSNDYNFISDFKKHSNIKVRSLILNSKVQTHHIRPKKNEKLVFLVNGNQSIQLFNKYSKFFDPNKTIVVNTRFKGHFNQAKFNTIHLQFRHPDVGVYLAKLLNESRDRNLASEKNPTQTP